jgi:acyl-CoA synthetase (AMP-forming)/AMP-acid ligase II
MISNGALLANQQMIKERLELRPGSRAVSWLPPYHDMGLTTNVLLPLFAGIEVVLMEPETFMLRPELWLRELSAHPDVSTAAPDFAYRFAAARVGADVRRTLDLRGWRTALTGAEPIRADTIRTFETAFAGCGLRPSVFTPAYGLAESTLFVSGAPVDAPPTIRRFDRAGLQAGRAVPTDGPAAVEVVGLGRPADGVEVVVTDPGTGAALMALEVGEVWVRSPSNGLGYWGQPSQSRATFAGRRGVPGSTNVDEGWLRTGDLGFLDEWGQVFVTGRQKETIIIRGANYVPQDFEQLVQEAHRLLTRGPAAAFADADAPDRVVVVVEVDRAADRDALVDALADGVRSAAAHLAVQTEVLAVTAGQIPRTTSGKVRRLECADRHRRGELRIICSSRDAA